MPLETKIVPIPLVAGMMQKADAIALDPPGMVAVLNKQFTRQGAFDTRPCQTTLPTTSLNGAQNYHPRSLLGTAHEFVTVDEKHLAYAWDDNAQAWTQRGRMPTWQVGSKPLLRSSVESLEPPQMVYAGGFLWSFYKRAGAWNLLKLDPASGRALGTDISVVPSAISGHTFNDARIACNGTVFCVLVDDDTDAALKFTFLNVASPSVPASSTTVGAYAATYTVFDVFALQSDFALGYTVNGADLNLTRITDTGTVVETSGGMTYLDPVSVSVASASQHAWLLATSDGSTTPAMSKQATLFHHVWGTGVGYTSGVIYDFAADAQNTGGVAITMYDTTNPIVLCTESWVGQTTHTWGTFCAVWNDIAGTFSPYSGSTSGRMTPQVSTDTRPFSVDGRWYAWARCDAPAIGSVLGAAGMGNGYALLDLTNQVTTAGVVPFAATVTSWACPRQLTIPNATGTGRGVSVATDGAGKFWSSVGVLSGPAHIVWNAGWPHLYLTIEQAHGADLVTLDTTRAFGATAVSIETLSLVNGGSAWAYSDVAQQPDLYTYIGGPSEWGFFTAPDGATATAVAGGGLADGDYFYYVVYEWIDDNGHKMRSAPFAVDMVTAGAGNNWVELKLPYLKLTNKQGLTASSRPPAIVLYRAAGSLDAVPYRVTPLPATTTWQNSTDPTVAYMTYTDKATTLSISGNEILYTFGGVSPDEIPPPFSCVVAHRGRYFGAAGAKLWFTKQYTFDSVPGFNSLNVISVSDGDDITGLASLDSALIVFKSGSIFIINGEGPSDSGAGNDFTPTKVATPLGCIEPRSIATTSEGVVFQAAEGLFMLNRSMQVEYIGAGVEDDLAAFPVVTSAVYSADQYQVRFACAGEWVHPGGETPAWRQGVTLVYDLTFKNWARWYAADGRAQALGVANGHVAALTPAFPPSSSTLACVRLEDGAATDDGAGVASGFITAFVKLDGIEGYQRVRRCLVLGAAPVSETGVIVAFSSDYGQTTATFTLSAFEVWKACTKGGFQYEFHLPTQKCEGLQVSVLEVPDLSAWPMITSFVCATPGNAAAFSAGQHVYFVEATASGSQAAYDAGGATYAVVASSDPWTGEVVLTEDVSGWTEPPMEGWFALSAIAGSTKISPTTHLTTASVAAGVLATSVVHTPTPGRGITWRSVSLEVATMAMRYKGLAPTART